MNLKQNQNKPKKIIKYEYCVLTEPAKKERKKKLEVLPDSNIVLSYLFDWVDTFMYWLSHFIEEIVEWNLIEII